MRGEEKTDKRHGGGEVVGGVEGAALAVARAPGAGIPITVVRLVGED